MNNILLSLGSNIGDRAIYIKMAISYINKQVGKITATAPIYETSAWGNTEQAPFLNTCIIVKTLLSPLLVFEKIKQIEKILQRKNSLHWGPREIDIDIIFYKQLVISTVKLTIPHANAHLRNFVLLPSKNIAAGWIHPQLKKTIGQLYAQSKDPLKVSLWKKV